MLYMAYDATMSTGRARRSRTEGEPILELLQPRYRQVQQALADEIVKGGRSVGSHLPPERALAEHFSVSRVTLRHALAELERAGLVIRDLRGWVVAGSVIGEPPNELMSFSEMAAARGLSAGSREISRSVRAASIDEAETLGLAPGADLFEFVRLRSMDEVPMLIATSLIPLSLVPEIQKMVPPGGSLYSVLEDSFGLRPARARITVEAVPAGSKEAKLLGLNQGEPLLYCHQLTEDETGRTIEICEMRYRGDRYRFRASLVRAGALETRAPLEPAAVQGQV
jgi:GntR family transcriptional regulator